MIRPPKSNCDVWLKFQFQFWTKKSVQFEIQCQNWILIKGGCWNPIKFSIKNYHFWSIFDEFWTISILKCQLKDQQMTLIMSIKRSKMVKFNWKGQIQSNKLKAFCNFNGFRSIFESLFLMDFEFLDWNWICFNQFHHKDLICVQEFG